MLSAGAGDGVTAGAGVTVGEITGVAEGVKVGEITGVGEGVSVPVAVISGVAEGSGVPVAGGGGRGVSLPAGVGPGSGEFERVWGGQGRIEELRCAGGKGWLAQQQAEDNQQVNEMAGSHALHRASSMGNAARAWIGPLRPAMRAKGATPRTDK